MYEHAITRGEKYKVINQNTEKYRIIGDHGKRIWISKWYFDLDEKFVLQMVEWNFDDNVSSLNIVEVTILFNNGSRRWCNITTPDKLVVHFENPRMDPPGLFIDNLIIVKSLERNDVEQTFKYLDSQGELEKATRLLDIV